MTVPQKHWALAWRWYKETLRLLESVIWQYATTNVHTDSWNTVTPASRMGLCTTDSKCLKQNVINKRRKNDRGKIQLASNPYPELWYPRDIILIVCRVPMNTYTQHLKTGCIKIQTKRCLSSSFLILLLTMLLVRPSPFCILSDTTTSDEAKTIPLFRKTPSWINTQTHSSSSTYPLFS